MTRPLAFRPSAGAAVLALEPLLASRLLIQGVSGSGKSMLLRGLLESTHGQVQQIVIDREGEFATLRTRFDYVLAGRDGDVAADPATAKLLCRRIIELGASLIVDLSELRLPEQRDWVRRFFDELVHLPRELWHPVLVALDEAHLFCPERGSGESSATQAVIDVATLGRKRGYALIAATQRLSKLHKDCAAELLNKLIGYTDDVDLQRAGEQLGMTKEQRAELKRLDERHFYAYGPAISRQPVHVIAPVPETVPPARGRARSPAPPPPAAIKKLLAQLADLPSQAADEARTVSDLQRENRDLQARIRKLERGAPATPPQVKVETRVERVEIPILKDAQLTRLEKVTERWSAAGSALVEVGREITTALAAAKRSTNGHAPAPRQPSPAVRAPSAAPRPVARPSSASAATPTPGVSRAQQRILDALAFMESIGIAPLDKTQLALLADAKPTSGGYFNNLGALRTAGLIEYPRPATVGLTDAGRAVADLTAAPQTTEALQRSLFAKLSAAQVRILEALIDTYPDAIAKDELAARSEQRPTSGGYFNNLGRLRSLGLIDYPAPGQVVALPVLFLEGAP